MYILGIETSCDDTGVGVVCNGNEVLSNVVNSQEQIHAFSGGVVPEIASREHIGCIIPTIDLALKNGKISLKDVDAIAATMYPGLIGSLLIGINTAKGLSLVTGKPFIGVNHLQAHLYGSIMFDIEKVKFPALSLIISGGHTVMLYARSIKDCKVIGKSIDDAVGESFDKVASLLGLPYPGGPNLEALAATGDPYKYKFSGGKIKSAPLNFSFSGLKTKVLYTLKGQNSQKSSPIIVGEEEKKHVAASFQRAVFEDLRDKLLSALKLFPTNTIICGGGVSNNETLRKYFLQEFPSQVIYWPREGFSTDNGAMIAGLAFYQYRHFGGSRMSLEPFPKATIESIEKLCDDK